MIMIYDYYIYYTWLSQSMNGFRSQRVRDDSLVIFSRRRVARDSAGKQRPVVKRLAAKQRMVAKHMVAKHRPRKAQGSLGVMRMPIKTHSFVGLKTASFWVPKFRPLIGTVSKKLLVNYCGLVARPNIVGNIVWFSWDALPMSGYAPPQYAASKAGWHRSAVPWVLLISRSWLICAKNGNLMNLMVNMTINNEFFSGFRDFFWHLHIPRAVYPSDLFSSSLRHREWATVEAMRTDTQRCR